MADKKTKVTYELNPEVNEQKLEKELSKVDTAFKKHADKVIDGYIKLSRDVAEYKYPKQTVGKDGITRGVDYSKLQKAQDELVSSWNRLSKQGFSSRDEDILEALRSFRKYQGAVKNQYEGNYIAEFDDKIVSKIRNTIGDQITKQFSRVLGKVPVEEGSSTTTDFFTSVEDDKLYEKYAKRAVLKNKAAQAAGINLSSGKPLTAADRAEIVKYEQKLTKEAMAKKVVAEREYEKKHYKQTQKKEKKALKQLQKQMDKDIKNAIPLPKRDLPDVALTTTEVEDLSRPREDIRTEAQRKMDEREDKQFLKGVEHGAPARKLNTPHHEVNLGIRSQAWDPTYLTKAFLQKLDHAGTYVETNSLLRQTAAALPEEIKKSIESLVKRINRGEAEKAFSNFEESDKKQWSDIANQIGMSESLLVNVSKVQSALMSGKKEVTSEDLKNAITVALADAIEHGKSQIAAENYNKAIKSIVGMLMSRYDNSKDAIGGTEDKGERGVGVNYEEVAETLKEVFKDFQETAEVLIQRAVKEFPEFYDGTLDKEKKSTKTTTVEKTFNAKLSELTAIMDTSGKTLANLFSYTATGNATEEISDAKQIKASRTAIDVAKENEQAGLDSEGTATVLLGQQTTANRLSGEIKDLLYDIFSMISEAITPKTGGSGGKGNRPPIANITNLADERGGPGSYQSILSQITQHLQNIDVNVGNILQKLINPEKHIPTNAMSLVPGEEVKTHRPERETFVDKTRHNRLNEAKLTREMAIDYEQRAKEITIEEKAKKDAQRELDKKARKAAAGELTNKVKKSKVMTSTPGIFGKFQDMLQKSLKPAIEAERIMNANAEEQMKMRAQRIEMFGENKGRRLSDTGDKAQVKRTKQLFGWQYKKDGQNKELFQDVRLTKGFDRENTVDTSKILGELQNVLKGPEMFKAQTGGVFKNLFGSMFGYLGMDSLEKSRAQAEGLNQVMANTRAEILELLQGIQAKEMTLKGMQDMGTAKFNEKGQLIKEESSLGAEKTFLDLEEQKAVLKGALAEVRMIDKIISKSGGKIKTIIKRIGFVMPELMQNNTILQNLNAGLDKNGKALKFQSRTAEVLNYTFQLMSRHIGQMWKNWMLQLNPITQIKKAFSDFTSYSPKWQRTMNVVKYNLRDIILPIMEKIAQLLVNMIGFVDIILQKIQAAFGNKPISLFDQENADKVKKTYEDMYDLSASFDELHDVGSSSSENNADNLLGEIYKPELSQEWIDLATEIGNLFSGIITGDLGFSEVMAKILSIAWQGITTLWNEIILPFVTNTIWPIIKNNWLEILAWMLGAFVAWNGLKKIGTLLVKALFGKLTLSNIGSLLGNLGKGLWDKLGLSTLGQQLQVGFLQAFKGQGLIGAIKGGGASLGSVFAQAFLAVAGVAIAGISYMAGFDMAADDTSYNVGLMSAGGNAKDKKASTGAYATSMLGGAAGGALAGLAIGGPLGAAIGAGIGAIAGAITTSLAPAFEKAEIKARNMNNELQKIEYYEGQVKGYSTQVSQLTEMQKLLNDTLTTQKQKVFEEGEQLGITKERMNELILATTNGKFTTDMLSGSELGLKDSLIALNNQQLQNEDVTNRLETAKRKLQKAELDLAIAEDVAAGNFEMAAARIAYAEATTLYTEEEATAKRIALYKKAGKEEAKYLLQDLSKEQRAKMANINNMNEKELASFVKTWRNSSQDVKDAFLSGVDQDTQSQFKQQMNEIDGIIKQHQGFWQGVGDTLKEIFTFGIADTWTYNGEKKATAKYKSTVASMAVGTNYVPSDGLVYLHQGEAVIPKKYNRPYEPTSMSPEEQAYMRQMMNTMRSLDNTMKQGINVNGQFVQRGSDLVAVVNKTKSQTGADLLSNVAYAR